MLTAQPQAHFLFRRKDAVTGEILDPGLAFVPDIERSLTSLEELARDENWGSNRSVLHNYLNYTVHQLVREGKVVEAADDQEVVDRLARRPTCRELNARRSSSSSNRSGKAGSSPTSPATGLRRERRSATMPSGLSTTSSAL